MTMHLNIDQHLKPLKYWWEEMHLAGESLHALEVGGDFGGLDGCAKPVEDGRIGILTRQCCVALHSLARLHKACPQRPPAKQELFLKHFYSFAPNLKCFKNPAFTIAIRER